MSQWIEPEDDPISAFLRNYFRFRVIVAMSYEHCRICARDLGLDYRSHNVLFIRTNDYSSSYRLMGRTIRRQDVIFYETAHWGKHYDDIMRDLRTRYVD